MRAQHLQQTRPQWYDRNMAERAGFYTGLSIAPHGTTTRFNYTVPANKKFLLEASQCMTQRESAAAPAGTTASLIEVICTNGAIAQLPWVYTNDNTVGLQRLISMPFQAAFIEGATVFGVDQDTSTGGTCTFYEFYKGSEYDA